MLIAEFKNDADGLMSKVSLRNDDKFAVVLIDLDTNEVLPTIKIFADESKAREFANSLVNPTFAAGLVSMSCN